ncbi:unnamed protein product, partial [marine sediment metagenome]
SIKVFTKYKNWKNKDERRKIIFRSGQKDIF